MDGQEALEVAAYGRNSSDQQTTSQEIQADVFDVFMQPDEGFQRLLGKPGRITRSYRDHGKSASKKRSKRTDFSRMLKDVESGEVKIIVVVNLSRFSRLHPLDTMKFYQTLFEHGCKLISIDDMKIWDYHNFSDLIQLLCKSNEDYEYARTIARNTSRGWAHRAKLGKSTSKTPAYGLQRLIIDDRGEQRIVKRLEQFRIPKGWSSYVVPGDKQEQEVVRWLFHEYDSKDISFGQLQRQLNQHDNPQVRLGATGIGWTVGAIRHILENRHYIGLEVLGLEHRGEHYRFNGKDVVETRHATDCTQLITSGVHNQGIVDPELFQRVQEKIGRNKRRRRKPQPTKDNEGHPLTGILVCGNCGRNLHAHPNNGRTKYSCDSSRNNASLGCGSWSVREDVILPYIVSRLDKGIRMKLAEPDEVGQVNRVGRLNQDDHEAKLAELDAKIAAIKAKIKTASVDAAIALSESLTHLVDERADLAKQRTRIDSGELQRQLAERWFDVVDPTWIETDPRTIPVQVDDLGRDNPAVGQLGIGEEVDRLFNVRMLRPSTIRRTLDHLGVEVRLWWQDVTKQRTTGKKRTWRVDYGKIEATIGGHPITGIDEQSRVRATA
jgi:DNA invertase Pin-like site-specific DNA recombinase